MLNIDLIVKQDKIQARNEQIHKVKDEENQIKKDEALERAMKFWADKQDPRDSLFICDACGGVIRDKEGTSLLGGWMRCKSCSARLFSRWDRGEI